MAPPRPPLPKDAPDTLIAAYATGDTAAPAASDLIDSLLALEKQARHTPPADHFSQLVGTWRLKFVTGTKKARKQAGKVLGAGQYLPGLLRISLRYEATPEQGEQTGMMINQVQVAGFQIVVSGPCRWQMPRNLLAFDFTRLQIHLGPIQLYQGFL